MNQTPPPMRRHPSQPQYIRKRRRPRKKKRQALFAKYIPFLFAFLIILTLFGCLIGIASRSVTVEIGDTPDYSHITSNGLMSIICKVDTDVSAVDTSKLTETKIPLKIFGFIKGSSTLRVVDTVSPEIQPQNVWITAGLEVTGDMFARETRDNTKVSYKIVSPKINNKTSCQETVSVLATDEGGNSTEFQAKLTVVEPQNSLVFECGTPQQSIENTVKTLFINSDTLDFSKVISSGTSIVIGKNNNTAFYAKISLTDTTPPIISGHKDISIDLGKSYDYSQDVTAIDSFWGTVKVDVDSSAVNTSLPGAYKVIYTATDGNGNTAKETVTVTVAKPSKVSLDVKNILQKPALPNGCEVVSLAIALKYVGYTIDPVKLYDEFMPQSPLKNGDPWTTYVGNAKGTGYGCYAPCVVTTGNAYLASVGSSKTVSDVSGQSLSYYENLLIQGTPVIMWGTLQMNGNPKLCWEDTINGKYVNWHSYSHCLVLIGYTDNTYIFCDPLRGVVEYSKSKVETSFDLNYRQACIVK